MAFLNDVVKKTLPIMLEEWTDATLYAPYQGYYKILFLNIMDVLEEQALMDQYADTV
jgi:hypothetical protein